MPSKHILYSSAGDTYCNGCLMFVWIEPCDAIAVMSYFTPVNGGLRQHAALPNGFRMIDWRTAAQDTTREPGAVSAVI